MLKETEDYYFDERGFLVFTEKYHKKRGYCCKMGCKHCPWKKQTLIKKLKKK